MSLYKRYILKIAEMVGLFYYMRYRERLQPTILMYHRIIDHPDIDGIKPAVFERQIAYLSKKYRVVSMDQLVEELKSGAIKPYTLALTFDDGHFDFYENAWPILKQYEVPASLYVATDFVEQEQWLWPDLLKYILLYTKVENIEYEPLGEISIDRLQISSIWSDIADSLLDEAEHFRFKQIKVLANKLEVALPTSPVSPFHSVSWAELKQMKSEGLDIGSHTVSHPLLGQIENREIESELYASGQKIMQQLGGLPQGICYPSGRTEDVDDRVFQLAKETGYTYGLVAYNQLLNADRLFELGRIAASSDYGEFRWRMARK